MGVDHLGKDQRKTKDDKSKEDKPIKGLFLVFIFTINITHFKSYFLLKKKLWMKPK